MKSVYVMSQEGTAALKIGVATNPKLRLSSMRVGSPRRIALVYSVACEDAAHVESCVHNLLADQRTRGEWFAITEEEAKAAIHFIIAKLRVAIIETPPEYDYRRTEQGGPCAPRTERHRWYLREWLRYRGMSQEQLARAIGVDGGDVSKWVNNKRRYNEDVLEGFAAALEITPAELLGTDPFAVAAERAA